MQSVSSIAVEIRLIPEFPNYFTVVMRCFLSMTEYLDLLGDPGAKRGRPPHIQTGKKRNKIQYLLALGWTNTRVAHALRITGAARRKYYFRQPCPRDEARQRSREALPAKTGRLTRFFHPRNWRSFFRSGRIALLPG